jgi:hypothetical protein
MGGLHYDNGFKVLYLWTFKSKVVRIVFEISGS